ncbi:hypothetical protein [Pseudonocardia sp. HH130630-07]|uniref:hypothetical protein n=1 Tax=Pseudonocardia sp. HH130630-07 TaxID=1690815 RepID=UPI000814CAF3|nr:hypothetical protein [Pseudonocardia sp. HH130630-07]ANY06054.1 hypothetical protein AFB00_06755 [Pseudonocardia sp. HH130630-07]
MPGNDPVLTGVIVFLAIALGPAVLVWLVGRLPGVVRRARRGRGRAAPPAPVGPPLERLVADLRRLERMRRDPRPTTWVQRVALLAAYDEVLLATCRAVGVEDPPLRAFVADGGVAGALDRGRALARIRTEAALEATGVRIDPPGPAVA